MSQTIVCRYTAHRISSGHHFEPPNQLETPFLASLAPCQQSQHVCLKYLMDQPSPSSPPAHLCPSRPGLQNSLSLTSVTFLSKESMAAFVFFRTSLAVESSC